MVSEAASTTNRRSHTDEAPQGSQAARGMNRPPCGQGCRAINRNVRENASNLGILLIQALAGEEMLEMLEMMETQMTELTSLLPPLLKWL